MIDGLSIDFETADKITVANLKQYMEMMQNDIDNYKIGGWLHQDDFNHNKKMIEAIKFVINDFDKG